MEKYTGFWTNGKKYDGSRFIWNVTGEIFAPEDTTLFGNSQPDRAHYDTENCLDFRLFMDESIFKMNDLRCFENIHVICEKTYGQP